MNLITFSYDTNPLGEDDRWHLEPVKLGRLNLIVGKNATGKSRALVVIHSFAKMIHKADVIYLGVFDFFFQKGAAEYHYTISNKDGNIIETLLIDGKPFAERENTTARIFSVKQNVWQEVSPPADRLLLHVRRDIEEYAYFEEIITWSENVQNFSFGHVHVSSFIEGTQEKVPASIENIPELIQEMSPEQKVKLLSDLNSIGYNISKLDTRKGKGDIPFLYIKENEVKGIITQRVISQGMFRVIALLIFIHHLLEQKKASLIVIDDLCEGLDYERATKLGKLLFGSLLPENVQLVATSNDSFLMDVVDIKDWNVFHRKGTCVKSLNYRENKSLFENFKFSGLSNFDFFSSDYIASHLNQE
ncbi:hypothetical protein BH11BAC7_BH11BAC7_07670 [soil metagenome]